MSEVDLDAAIQAARAPKWGQVGKLSHFIIKLVDEVRALRAELGFARESKRRWKRIAIALRGARGRAAVAETERDEARSIINLFVEATVGDHRAWDHSEGCGPCDAHRKLNALGYLRVALAPGATHPHTAAAPTASPRDPSRLP